MPILAARVTTKKNWLWQCPPLVSVLTSSKNIVSGNSRSTSFYSVMRL